MISTPTRILKKHRKEEYKQQLQQRKEPIHLTLRIYQANTLLKPKQIQATNSWRKCNIPSRLLKSSRLQANSMKVDLSTLVTTVWVRCRERVKLIWDSTKQLINTKETIKMIITRCLMILLRKWISLKGHRKDHSIIDQGTAETKKLRLVIG